MGYLVGEVPDGSWTPSQVSLRVHGLRFVWAHMGAGQPAAMEPSSPGALLSAWGTAVRAFLRHALTLHISSLVDISCAKHIHCPRVLKS